MDNMCIVERHARPHQSVLFMSDLNRQHELMITTTCIDVMITCQKLPLVEVREERSKCKYRDLSSYNSLQPPHHLIGFYVPWLSTDSGHHVVRCMCN